MTAELTGKLTVRRTSDMAVEQEMFRQNKRYGRRIRELKGMGYTFGREYILGKEVQKGMKFLHISDLHLGKRVNEFPMQEDQEFILKRILEIAQEEAPDALLIAGDVFDKSVPSEQAVQLWDSFLEKLSEREIPVVAISGNHDSAVRFSNHGSLLTRAGIHLSPVYRGETKCYTCRDSYGEVCVYLLPFIKPVQVREYFPDAEISDYTDAVRAVIGNMQVDESKRNVLVAHQFVIGAKRSESEEVSVGGLDSVNASVFDPFDYVALGHIHGPQYVERETIRYCGTPLKYSFSEKDHHKSVTVVEMAEKGNLQIRTRELTPLHDLREVRGLFVDLMENPTGDHMDYIHAVMVDEEDIPDAMAKLRVVYPNLMKISYDNTRTRENREIGAAENVESKSSLELFEEFYEMQNNRPMSEVQRAFLRGLMEDMKEEMR